MAPFGFCAGTYQSESLNVDAQDCMNFYPENNGGASASPVALYPTPGLLQFADLGTGPVGGLFKYLPAGASSERVFAVATHFTEIFSDGTHQDYNFVATSLPVTMAANNANQIAICTGGDLWVFNTITNSASQVAMNLSTQFSAVGFLNGYFLALQENSQTVWFSALEDGASWDALDFFAVNVYSDNVLSMVIDHGLIWLHSPKQAIAYSNTQDPFNPFLPAFSSPIESGTGAPFSMTPMDNSLFWIGADSRGTGVAFRLNGYTPVRVSTFAVENEWRQYPMVSDAIGYSYQENGHPFWQLYFPSANATWDYDAASGQWHKRGYWTGSAYVAHRSRCHESAFGKHLVGDTQSGKIWSMGLQYLTDNGQPIRRYRRSPHLNLEKQRVFHKQMQVDLEVGLGPSIIDNVPGSLPTFAVLEDSNGQKWEISLDSSYQLHSTAVASGTVTPVILQDNLIAADSYQLSIQPDGFLVTTPTATAGVLGYELMTPLTTVGQIYVTNSILQSGPGINNYRGPYVWLRWSDDGGHTWKSEQFRDAGQSGEYNKRVIWRRLGKSRDRVYEFGTSEAFPCRVVNAYLWAGLANQNTLALPGR